MLGVAVLDKEGFPFFFQFFFSSFSLSMIDGTFQAQQKLM
jgi:hypothetical protein